MSRTTPADLRQYLVSCNGNVLRQIHPVRGQILRTVSDYFARICHCPYPFTRWMRLPRID